MNKLNTFVYFFILLLISDKSFSQNIDPKIDIESVNNIYTLKLKAVSALPIDIVLYKLTNYENIKNYHPSIIDSQVLGYTENGVLVETKLKPCFLFFCQNIKRVEEVKNAGNYFIISNTIPDLSDFDYGVQEWRLTPFINSNDIESGTIIRISIKIKPKNTLFPIIGPIIIKHELKTTTLEFIDNLDNTDY